jgi:hypothetical protein
MIDLQERRLVSVGWRPMDDGTGTRVEESLRGIQQT